MQIDWLTMNETSIERSKCVAIRQELAGQYEGSIEVQFLQAWLESTTTG